MAIDSKEEVFAYFTKLSGAKRIEILSGLVHSCIPLEMRFLATLVESLARRDYVTLLEDEHKANSPQELQALCSTDLLADVSPFIRFPGAVPTLVTPTTGQRPPVSVSPSSINLPEDGSTVIPIVKPGDGSKGGTISPPPALSIPDVVHNTTNYGNHGNKFNPHVGVHPVTTTVPLGQQQMTTIHPPVECILSNVRKKIVVYLCLLNSTNYVAASVLYDAFRKYLSADNLKRHLELSSINISGLTLASSNDHAHVHQQDPMQSTQGAPTVGPMIPTVHIPILDPQLIAELTLIHTLAIYHPAFQWEQQSLLSFELEKLTELFNNLSPRLYSTSHHAPPQPGFIPIYHPHPSHLSVAGYLADSKKNPPLCCYNCGGKGHLGRDCTEETLDEATRDTNFHINLSNPAPIPITIPTIMNQVTQVIHVATGTLTPPLPLSPATSNTSSNNNRVTDLQNGPGSLTGRKNTINNANESASNHHQTLRPTDSSSSIHSGSTSPAVNSLPSQASGASGSSRSAEKRATNQLYVAPHLRSRGDRDPDSSPRSSNDTSHSNHNSRSSQSERIVKVHYRGGS